MIKIKNIKIKLLEKLVTLFGFDRLIVSSLEKIITENLGDKTMSKIEHRLESKYGISLTESIGQFQKFDVILREFFGAGADGLEKKFLESICKVKKSENKNIWFSIEDETTKKIILETYGDEDNVKILNFVNQEPNTISDILNHFKFPQTSGYRKINNLIDTGLLIEDGYVMSIDKKKVSTYHALFDSIRIDIVKNKIIIDVQFEKNNLHESAIMQTVFSL
jgi:hypothetical protein